ncbi:MAG: alpha/beta hydrolase, partial [Lachnospiraceae bacterium]|nr:alpha/beta hydrolase [Lachnospiraceae bacterium]
GGHKRDSQCIYLINGLLRGYAVVNVNYRLIGEVIFPYPVYDVKAAVRFLRANAKKYCLDPARFAVSGDSAGAYFASILATSAGVEALEDRSMGASDCDSSVQAMIGMFGLYDIILASQFTEDAPPMPSGVKISNFADLFAGVNCREAKGIASMVSPISYVSKNCPPVLIQAGMEDEVVPYQSSVEFVNRINAVCGDGRATLESIPGGKHGDPAYESEQLEESRFAFLDRVLK